MFDVFYTGPKPNLFVHEALAKSAKIAAKKSKTKYFWFLNGGNDYSKFDFNWLPDKWEEHQYHIFSDQWCRNSETYFINKYSINDCVFNYHNDQIITRVKTPDNWHIPIGVLFDSIDFSWHPDPMDLPYVYHFPTRYYKSSGLTYTVPGATQIKFIDPFKVKFISSKKNWHVPEDVEKSTIDFCWRPDSLNEPFIYHFPTKFNKSSGVKYIVPEATRDFFVRPFYIIHLPDKSNWVIPNGVDETLINFTWRPDPLEPPYIYKFPSKWAADAGLEYHAPGATTFKFISDKCGKFIYDITKIFSAETLPRYYIKTTINDLIKEHQGKIFWALNQEMNYDKFDFSWHPDNSQRCYLHVFGSQWQSDSQTFYVDTTSIPSHNIKQNFVKNQTVQAGSNSPIFYVDKFNIESAKQFKELLKKHNNITKIRYVSSMIDTIKRISKKTDSLRFWVISSENDYTDFDFDWHPEIHQNYMFHVFGSEHQKWSDTYLVNKDVFDDHIRWCKNITDMPDLNFVEDQKVKSININEIYEIDFGQHNTLKLMEHNTLKTTRFVDSYLSVIKRIVSHSSSEHIWLISNICDYSNFDFNWRPDYSQLCMLHVFGPGNNKFGDTFFIHVPTFKKQMDKLELLDWFKTVNYCTEQIVPRLQYDQVPYTGDNLTATIKQHRFNSPYALFFPEGQDVSTIDYNPSVWRFEDRAIHTFTESSSIVLAPRDTLQYLGTQCYDYPMIKREKDQFLAEKPLDIIFISNGESIAELMYEHLKDVTKNDNSLVVKRVDGVNGRAAAYKAAAELSDTDWAFNVFAKLEITPDFDFHWQPDRLQEPKHYIFHALNPINGLEYGHQGVIAYNKKLVLETDEWGLDFTLSKAHEVIPVLSGIARYDTDPWIVWRTAYREVIKLLANEDVGGKENRIRLMKWCQGTDGKYGYMSVNGAVDARRYFNEVGGDHDKLMLTFEWAWLKAYYDKYYYDTV